MTGHEEVSTRKSQFFKGLAELALLSLLQERPGYGLEVLEALRTKAGLAIAAGTVYPLLHRLEASGYVRSAWRMEDAASRPRKYYALTEEGAGELDQLLAQWRRINTTLTAFLDRETKP
jgi:PadR family transcriptional regulator, regulatory protein PadR